MPAARALTVDGGGVAAEFLLDAAAVEEAARTVTRANGEELLRRIQLNANTGIHGRGEGHIPGTGPGPNVVTGEYVASWRVDFETVGPLATAVVSTDAAQADRLEYGFHGVDSIGRRYDQPAFPHIGPAVDEVEERVMLSFDAIVDQLVRGVRL